MGDEMYISITKKVGKRVKDIRDQLIQKIFK